MPCGGIYPMAPIYRDDFGDCFNCNKPLRNEVFLAVEEWDAGIHVDCLREFLMTPEGEVIRIHQHPVITEIGESDPGLYLRLLCYSPELSMSDWALCRVDESGDEIIVDSFSRVEYVDEKR